MNKHVTDKEYDARTEIDYYSIITEHLEDKFNELVDSFDIRDSEVVMSSFSLAFQLATLNVGMSVHFKYNNYKYPRDQIEAIMCYAKSTCWNQLRDKYEDYDDFKADYLHYIYEEIVDPYIETKRNENHEKYQIDRAKQLLRNNGYLVDNLFHIDDIIIAGSDSGITLTKKDADVIRHIIHKSHDATIGINVDVIESAIQSLIVEKEDND